MLPFPFFGRPEQAELYILASNPGYVSINRQEQADPLLAEAFRKNLQHNNLHPYLDPQFDKTAGYKWWRERLKDVFLQFKPEEQHTLAEKLMCVQLFPYHSKEFRSSVARHLPTQQYARYLVLNAVKEEKEIVVLRAPWRDLLRKLLAPIPLEDFPFITVVKFQGQRTPSLNQRDGWLQPDQFDRIIKRLSSSIVPNMSQP